MSKKAITKRRVIAAAFLLFAACIAYAVFRYYNPTLGFKYFEPAYLPPHVQVIEKRVSITRGHASVQQNLRAVDWVYAINEYKAGTLGYTQQVVEENYDPTSVKPTCHAAQTAAGMQYRVCHWIDYGFINVHEVKFIKEGTQVRALIPTKVSQGIPIPQIEKFVDSFERKSTLGIPVQRSAF